MEAMSDRKVEDVKSSKVAFSVSRATCSQGHDIVSESKRVQFDEVEVEQDLGRLRPDVTATANGKSLCIEIKVTNAVGDEKGAHYERLGQSAIEIDASDLPRDASREDINERVIECTKNKTWLFDTRAADRLALCERKDARSGYVACPLPKAALLDNLPNNGWRSAAKWSALRGRVHVHYNCLYCKHALWFTEEQLYCDGTTESTKDYTEFPGGF